MNKLLAILCLTFLLAGELEVDGDLKVTGNIEAGQIESLQQTIIELQAQIAALQAQITALQIQSGIADCAGVIGGSAFVDLCGECNGDNSVCAVFDIDGNSYIPIQIGNQVWLDRNLNVIHYRNGDALGYNNINNDSNLSETYGRLYAGSILSDSRGVCPEGFHVPSEEEWMELEIYLGMTNSEYFGWRGTNEGGKLKEAGYSHWNHPNEDATNESGFTALPAGALYFNGGNYGFDDLGSKAFFWTSTGHSGYQNYVREVHYDQPGVRRDYWDNSNSFSIRCLQD